MVSLPVWTVWIRSVGRDHLHGRSTLTEGIAPTTRSTPMRRLPSQPSMPAAAPVQLEAPAGCDVPGTGAQETTIVATQSSYEVSRGRSSRCQASRSAILTTKRESSSRIHQMGRSMEEESCDPPAATARVLNAPNTWDEIANR